MAYLPYNFTWSDESPLFQYAPTPRDTTIGAGWNSSFTQSDPSQWAPETFPVGTSSHSTTNNQATVTLAWTGTAIYLQGTADQKDAGYGITIDGTGVTPVYGNGFLYSQSGMAYGDHTMVLSVKSGTVSVTGAIVTAGVGPSGSSINTKITTFTGVSLQTPPEVTLGSPSHWNAQLSYDTANYPRISTNTPGDTISFALQGASAFAVYGSTNQNHDSYQVTMTGTDGTHKVTDYNGLTHYINFNQLLYLTTGLDRAQNYTVTIQNTATSTSIYMDVASYTIYTATPPGQKSGGIPTGAIAGIAVGAAALVLAGIGLFFWMRRKGRRHAEEDTHESGTWDNTTHEVTPFNPYTTSPPASAMYPGSEMGSAMYGVRPSVVGGHRPTSSYDGPQSQSSSSGYANENKRMMVTHDHDEMPAAPVHAADAGPALPPMYDPQWGPSSSQGGSSSQAQVTSMGYPNEKRTMAPPPS